MRISSTAMASNRLRDRSPELFKRSTKGVNRSTNIEQQTSGLWQEVKPAEVFLSVSGYISQKSDISLHEVMYKIVHSRMCLSYIRKQAKVRIVFVLLLYLVAD